MDSLLERSKVESRYAEPTKHKADLVLESAVAERMSVVLVLGVVRLGGGVTT